MMFLWEKLWARAVQHPSRAVFTLAALCTLAALHTVPSTANGDAPIPFEAGDLLKRSVAAHGKLGPVTVQVTLDELKDGKTISTRLQTVQRNDSDHYVTEFSEGKSTVRLIARGDSLVVHNVTKDVYRTGKNYRVDLAMPLSRIRDGIAKGLKNPKTAAALKAARVSRSLVGGKPAYRLDWKEPVPLGSLPLRSLSVGVNDGLMCQALLQDSKAVLRATAVYLPRSTPFPNSTFQFTPPPGARDLDREETPPTGENTRP